MFCCSNFLCHFNNTIFYCFNLLPSPPPWVAVTIFWMADSCSESSQIFFAISPWKFSWAFPLLGSSKLLSYRPWKLELKFLCFFYLSSANLIVCFPNTRLFTYLSYKYISSMAWSAHAYSSIIKVIIPKKKRKILFFLEVIICSYLGILAVLIYCLVPFAKSKPQLWRL